MPAHHTVSFAARAGDADRTTNRVDEGIDGPRGSHRGALFEIGSHRRDPQSKTGWLFFSTAAFTLKPTGGD